MTGRNDNRRASRGATWGGRPRRGSRSDIFRRVTPLLVVIGSIAPAVLGSSVASAGSPYDPASDPFSMKAITEQTGVTDLWNQGITGAGVDVAVIDTGVVPVEGLATPGKIIYGPDLSLPANWPNDPGYRYVARSGAHHRGRARARLAACPRQRGRCDTRHLP